MKNRPSKRIKPLPTTHWKMIRQIIGKMFENKNNSSYFQ